MHIVAISVGVRQVVFKVLSVLSAEAHTVVLSVDVRQFVSSVHT